VIAPPTPAGRCWIGCDVGSTAVKAVALEAGTLRPLRQGYRRHGTRQAAGVIDLLHQFDRQDPHLLERAHLFFTGSGGGALAQRTGCRYVQEVNAVAIATERRIPEAGTIGDLGGQDAKIIIWTGASEGGTRRKFFSMNDKCAGGTGSVIDRIACKLGLGEDLLSTLRVNGRRVHSVAARCGVFAETDINSLQKQGVPADELLSSLYAAIVQQNLSVLTRGATLRPPVLLLGGPHAFLPGLVDAWRRELMALWRERDYPLPEGEGPGRLIRVPDDACYFAAQGAVFYGLSDGEDRAAEGPRAKTVVEQLARGLGAPPAASGEPGLLLDPAERGAVAALARQEKPAGFRASSTGGDVVIGLDAGSTSTKAVLLDLEGRVVSAAYRLSRGDPLEDARRVLSQLEAGAARAGRRLRVRGLGVTGYAKDLLAEFLEADLKLVETVAHARSALHVDPRVDVIVDVGGQDIKVLILRDGRVRDFRLNSQCSAGNGYFLQSTAQRFGIPLEAFADQAFRAQGAPRFHVGCAVFLESDIVNFQQIGWRPDEILAGLVRVLPRNIWFHVVGEPNLERLGRCFILQGGTQRNEAAVKAQADFIRDRVPGAHIRVHPHAGESGAIGAGLELLDRGLPPESRFIGFSALRELRVTSRQDESTRCRGCSNRCERTVLESVTPAGRTRRFVVAACDRGRTLSARPPERSAAGAPDFSARAAREAFRIPEMPPASRPPRSRRLSWGTGRRARARRRSIRIGIPRALNLYQTAPFFAAYLQELGLDAGQILFSGPTTEALFRAGARRGAIDNCYPCKTALAHVSDLVSRGGADWIFFPILNNIPQQFTGAIASSICPSSQGAPDVVKAAFTREGDRFAEAGMRYFAPVFHMAEPALFAREMRRFWGPLLGVGASENRRAIARARARADRVWEEKLRRPARCEIERLVRDRRVGIVVLGRPYHDDPGLNHRIFQDLNRLGYPIFSISSLPRDAGFLESLFGDEIDRGLIADPFDLRDVWRHSFSANSNAKVWAAKVVARHPNLVALDVSSFRCGHDAPIYATVEAILERAGTPYFTFHEIDENRPAGAIRLRVETIDYFLREYEARVLGSQRRAAAEAARETVGVGPVGARG